MNNSIDITIQAYCENFDAYIANTPAVLEGQHKEWIDEFLSLLPLNGRIFELGSAFGRDAHYFAEHGYEVVCTDVIPQALEKLTQEGFEACMYDFRDTPKAEWLRVFDGFFANGVLLHASPTLFESVFTNIATMLKTNGYVAFSLKTGEGELVSYEKLQAPRHFYFYTEAKLRSMFEHLPFEIVRLTAAEQGKWLHVIARYTG